MMNTNESLTLSTKDRIIRALDQLGIETELANALDLAEQFDSVTFISAVLELEQEFGIAVPDELLNTQFFASLDHTTELIEQLLQAKQ